MHRLILTFLVAALVTTGLLHQLRGQKTDRSFVTETRIPAGSTTLYSRAIGRGTPIIILHGGPDFDQRRRLRRLQPQRRQRLAQPIRHQAGQLRRRKADGVPLVEVHKVLSS